MVRFGRAPLRKTWNHAGWVRIQEDTMTQPTETHSAADDALDHLEAEIENLEHVSTWGRWLGWGAAAVIVLGLVGVGVYVVVSPPPTTSSRMSYVPSGSSPLELGEPRGATLREAPARLTWESVAGRFQYRMRIYVKGDSQPVVERFVTTPFVELTADERARIPSGKSFVWSVTAQAANGSTLGAGQSTFKVR
jgi:hypothetical protein